MRPLLAPAALIGLWLFSIEAASAAPPAPGQSGIEFRGGGFFPAGHSNFWDANKDFFTLDHSDLNGLIGTLGYVSAINNYVEFDIDAAVYYAADRSSDRDFTDSLGNEIFHDTRLFTSPITVSLRVLPAGRYAKRGEGGRHYVRRPVPYLGAGIGMVYWQYEEEGDFVFDSPLGPVVDYDRFKDTGVEFETHVKAGIEFPVGPTWNLTLEVRRSWAEATLDEGFPSMALAPTPVPRDLDLGGVSVLFGASLRF